MSDTPPPEAIRTLKARFAERDPTAEELGQLQADPRKGVQAIVKALANRQAKKDKWIRRARELSEYRLQLEAKGFHAVAGLDEAGRGPLAGPVATACVILPPDWDLPGLNDSKKIPEPKRLELAQAIREQARGYAVDLADREEIDRINILQATLASMRRAVAQCKPTRPDYLLLDAVALKDTGLPFRPVVGGDSRVAEIAAASILAKTVRDQHMYEMDQMYPGYGFADHKGYGTAAHMEALERLGPCPIHRRSFAPVASWELPSLRSFRSRISRASTKDKLRQVGLAIRNTGTDLTDEELQTLRDLYRLRDQELSS